MKTKEKNTKKLVKVSQSDLLALVAHKLKGRTLFPEMVERAKKYLNQISNNPF